MNHKSPVTQAYSKTAEAIAASTITLAGFAYLALLAWFF